MSLINSLIHWFIKWSFSSESSKHCLSQTVRAGELKFWENLHHPQCVTFHVSLHVSGVACHFFVCFTKWEEPNPSNEAAFWQMPLCFEQIQLNLTLIQLLMVQKQKEVRFNSSKLKRKTLFGGEENINLEFSSPPGTVGDCYSRAKLLLWLSRLGLVGAGSSRAAGMLSYFGAELRKVLARAWSWEGPQQLAVWFGSFRQL